MARLLVRMRWVVVVVWAVVGTIAVMRARHTEELLSIRGGGTRVTESDRAERLLRESLPRPVGDFYAVALTGPSSFAEGRSHEVLDSLTRTLRGLPYVSNVLSYTSTGDSTFLSHDASTTFLVVALGVSTDSAGKLVRPVRDVIRKALATFPDGVGYRAQVTGRAPLDLDIRTVSADDSRRGEARLLPITLVILVLAFGALVSAVLPLIIGVLAIAVSLTAIGYLTALTPMSVFVLNMTTMIGLGVGIDYSLLVVTRFREELTRGLRRREAAVRTVETAGVAVITSGATVVVGFTALLFTPMVETQSVGIGGLVVVGVAVLLSVTLLPAMLAILGRAIDQPKWLARKLAWYHAPQVWETWARSLSRHPRRALALGGLAIAILTAPVFWIRIGLPARNWWPAATEAGAGVQTLGDMGKNGVLFPVRVMVRFPEGESATSGIRLRGLKNLSDSLRADPRVADVRSIVDLQPGSSILKYSLLYSDLDSARARYPDFLDAYLSRDTRTTLLDVIPTDTTSLLTTTDLVRHARELRSAPIKGLKGAEILVGGYVANSTDFQRELLNRFPLMVALILISTGIMLAIAFRSVLVPIKAIIMNTFSVSATFGLIVLVFQYGLGGRVFGLYGPASAVYAVIPVFVFAIVFGLSMDYEVFLLTRIKEAFDRTGRNDEATMEGLSATASVITSAALIMVMVFGVFAFARVLVMQFLGFGLAVAVFLDATIIRMVLVPAFMQLAGRWNWWPGVRGPQGSAGGPRSSRAGADPTADGMGSDPEPRPPSPMASGG